MQEKLKEFTKSNQLFGVSLQLKGAENWQADMIELRRKRDDIQLANKGEGIRSIDDFWEQVPAQSRISLCVSGSGVLIKKVNAEQMEQGVEAVLPNVRTEEFVVQQMDMTDGRMLLALMRRDLLASIIKEFSEHNLWIVDIFLGPICFQSLSSLLPEGEAKLLVPGVELQFVNGKLNDYRKSETKPQEYYHLGGENLWANQLLPFASGLSTLVVGESRNLPEEVQVLADEFFARQVVIKGGALSLVVIFLSVLINFFVFDSLRKKQSQLSAQVETGRNLLTRLDALKIDFSQKEDFLLKSGLNTQSRLCFYADRLVVELPESVRLQSMEVNPLQKKIRKGKEIQYNVGNILVQGETDQPMDLNRWIQNLKKEEWVDKVEKQEYFLKQKNEPAEFILEIRVK
ncbi:hypothetical protein [Labilibaculum euxinus]